MKMVIHDGNEEFEHKLQEKLGPESEEIHYISDHGIIHHCVGCFGCWTKTPGQCVIRDAYGDMGALLARCDEVLLISKMTYGGYSPFVKNVLDRSISYMSPDFSCRNGEMHHKRRYRNTVSYFTYFYGPMLKSEIELAKHLVMANGRNLMGQEPNVAFCENLDMVLEEVSKL